MQKTRIVLAASIALAASSTALAEPATYSVEPNHSSVIFEARHFGTSTVRARIPAKSGKITIDPAARTGNASITVDTGAVVSGIPKFDDHLKSKDFFNASTYPDATFTATSFQFDGDKVTSVSGDLTMSGKSNPVTLKATHYNCYNSPQSKKQVCGGDFETTIQRSQWNINYGIPFVPDETHLLVQIEAVKD